MTLFQANHLGAILGIVNIRDSINDFDDDEKCFVDYFLPRLASISSLANQGNQLRAHSKSGSDR